MLACSAMVACTNDDVLENPNEKPTIGKTNAYMAIRLVNADGTASRATDTNTDGYINGSADENEVSTATFYFYGEDGNPINTTGVEGTNYVSLATSWHPQGEGNVEKISDAVITLKDKTYKEALEFKYVIAVLNEATPGQSNWVSKTDMETTLAVAGAKGKNAFSQTNETQKTHILNAAGNFTMSNSTYLDAESNIVAATPIESENILMQEPDEEELNYENAVTIYVERLAAKVEVRPISILTDNCYTLTSEIDTYDEATNKIVTSDVYSIKFRFSGWGLNGTTKDSYVVKRIQDDWTADNLFTAWNAADKYRSFWAKSMNYGSGNYPENFAAAADDAKDKTDAAGTDADVTLNYISWSELNNNYGAYDYCAENTNSEAILERGQFFSTVTSVLVKAQIVEIAKNGTVLKDGENNVTTLVRYSSGLYTMDAYKARVYNEVNIKAYTKAEEGAATAYNDVDWRQYLTVKDMHDGDITLEFTLPSTVTEKWYSDKECTNELDKNTISTRLAALTTENVGPLAECYNEGMMYYNIPIKHLKPGTYTKPSSSKDEETGEVTETTLQVQEGQYGVVRNHWYDINITDIKNLGEAVYNRYEDIIVDTKESNKWYIGAAMNILSWKIVNQDVTLE